MFTKVHRVLTLKGEGGVNGGYTLKKMFNMNDALHFHTGSLKINIFKVIFWEGGRSGGSHKRLLCL